MVTLSYPRILPAGDTALIVEFGDAIDVEINARVLALDRLVAASAIPGLVETLPTYRSLFVVYEPLAVSYTELSAALDRLLAEVPARPVPARGRFWRIPVVYGGEFGVDFAAVAARLDLGEAELIARHTAPIYRVFMIGFQPGYAYLGDLDPSLHSARHEVPRLKVPAGSVSIGGIQTSIHSVEAPSGWQLLGRTPLRLFDPTRPEPFLLATGDKVRFDPVPAAAWDALAQRVAAGESVAE